MTFCILGRQPALGLAELERLYGPDAVSLVEPGVAMVNAEVNIERLGGSLKTAELLGEFEFTDWRRLIKQISKNLPDLTRDMPSDGKIKLGLSLHGFNEDTAEINTAGLILKKALKKAGRSVRVVPNTESSLSSAQTLHNQLTSPLGLELVFIKSGESTLVGRVNAVQNINDYTQRDRGRPRRDAKVGMLPPKLTQIMINLASVKYGNEESQAPVILDPFCGTGVVLQEAALMGFSVYGTDIDERMIEFSRHNLDWLAQTYKLDFEHRIEVGDAISHTWQMPVDAVVCEGYLGEPLTSLPANEKFQDIKHECNRIAKGALKNLATQLKPSTPVVMALPAWWDGRGFHHLNVIDEIEEIGYTWVDLKHTKRADLLYHREDQIVGRELLVLTRK